MFTFDTHTSDGFLVSLLFLVFHKSYDSNYYILKTCLYQIVSQVYYLQQLAVALAWLCWTTDKMLSSAWNGASQDVLDVLGFEKKEDTDLGSLMIHAQGASSM